MFRGFVGVPWSPNPTLVMQDDVCLEISIGSVSDMLMLCVEFLYLLTFLTCRFLVVCKCKVSCVQLTTKQ